jgi:hypothetical protein
MFGFPFGKGKVPFMNSEFSYQKVCKTVQGLELSVIIPLFVDFQLITLKQNICNLIKLFQLIKMDSKMVIHILRKKWKIFFTFLKIFTSYESSFIDNVWFIENYFHQERFLIISSTNTNWVFQSSRLILSFYLFSTGCPVICVFHLGSWVNAIKLVIFFENYLIYSYIKDDIFIFIIFTCLTLYEKHLYLPWL